MAIKTKPLFKSNNIIAKPRLALLAVLMAGGAIFVLLSHAQASHSSAGCIKSSSDYSSCVTGSAEMQISRLYVYALNRLPDNSGLQYFVTQNVRKSMALQQIAAQIIASAEYANLHKTPTTADQLAAASQGQAFRDSHDQQISAFVGNFYSQLPAADMSTTGTGRFGIATGGEFAGVVKSNTADFSKTVDVINNSGAQWARATIRWDWVEPKRPNADGTHNYNWDVSDRLVKDFRLNGINLLLNINPATAPAWASQSTTTVTNKYVDGDQSIANTTSNGPLVGNVKDYSSYVAAVVARYKTNGVKYWQIGNEPNRADAWPSTNSDQARIDNYLAYLIAGHDSVHGADQLARVLTAGMGGNSDKIAGNISAPTFITKMYDTLYRQHRNPDDVFDIVSFHPYSYPGRSTDWPDGHQEILQVRDIMRFVGDGEKKIWATEFGAPTSVVSEVQQAKVLTDTYANDAQYDWLGPMFWYQIRGYRTQSDDQYNKNTFGLVRPDYSPKPAYCSLQRLTGATSSSKCASL